MEKKKNQEEQKVQEEIEKEVFRITQKGKSSNSSRSDYPATDKIESRSSTVARAMASSLMPRLKATVEERRAIVQLSLKEKEIPDVIKKLQCVYCGAQATHLDHLFPFITNKKPTGYFTEPANLVPCCDQCNQKKGAKSWYDYMKDLIDNEKDNNKKKELEERRTNLNLYCHEKHLPDKNGEVRDTNNEFVVNDHILNFMEDSNIRDWWFDLYNEVVNALHNAQIQIDAFKAGIIYSIKNQNIKKSFNQYFEGLILKEMEGLLPKIKDAQKSISNAKKAVKKTRDAFEKAPNNQKKKKKLEKNQGILATAQRDFNILLGQDIENTIEEKLQKEFERQITDNTNQKDNSQSSDKKRKKSFTLLEYGFRLSQNWEDPSSLKDNKAAKDLYKAAKNAFNRGFRYAKKHDRKTLERCISKGWLDDVIISETEES